MRGGIVGLLALTLVAGDAYGQEDNVVQEATYQDFTYQVTADPIDDSKTHLLLTQTEDASEMGEILTGGAGLGWVCYEGDPSPVVVVISSAYLSEGEATVFYRFDDREPVGPVGWQVVSSSLQSSTLTTRESAEVRAMVADAKTSARMVFRVEDNIDEGRQHTYTFSMYGVTDGLKRLPCVE